MEHYHTTNKNLSRYGLIVEIHPIIATGIHLKSQKNHQSVSCYNAFLKTIIQMRSAKTMLTHVTGTWNTNNINIKCRISQGNSLLLLCTSLTVLKKYEHRYKNNEKSINHRSICWFKLQIGLKEPPREASPTSQPNEEKGKIQWLTYHIKNTVNTTQHWHRCSPTEDPYAEPDWNWTQEGFIKASQD